MFRPPKSKYEPEGFRSDGFGAKPGVTVARSAIVLSGVVMIRVRTCGGRVGSPTGLTSNSHERRPETGCRPCNDAHWRTNAPAWDLQRRYSRWSTTGPRDAEPRALAMPFSKSGKIQRQRIH